MVGTICSLPVADAQEGHTVPATSTLIFYAVTTLFLGELATSLGMEVLAVRLDGVIPGSGAVVSNLSAGIAIIGPLFFLALAGVNAIVPKRDDAVG